MELAHRDGEELLALHGTPQTSIGNPLGGCGASVAEVVLELATIPGSADGR
jgi:hypothetical protein